MTENERNELQAAADVVRVADVQMGRLADLLIAHLVRLAAPVLVQQEAPAQEAPKEK